MALKLDRYVIRVYNRIVLPPTELHYAKRCHVAYNLLIESLSLLIRVLGNIYNAKDKHNIMKFQIEVRQVGDVVKIVTKKPHGRKWVTHHVHSYRPAVDSGLLGDFNLELAKSMTDADVAGIDLPQ